MFRYTNTITLQLPTVFNRVTCPTGWWPRSDRLGLSAQCDGCTITKSPNDTFLRNVPIIRDTHTTAFLFIHDLPGPAYKSLLSRSISLAPSVGCQLHVPHHPAHHPQCRLDAAHGKSCYGQNTARSHSRATRLQDLTASASENQNRCPPHPCPSVCARAAGVGES